MTALPFDLTITAFAALVAGLFLASFARGYSGFGFSALLVASGSLVTDPINVIALAIVLEVTASVLQAMGVWRDIEWKRVGVLCLGALIGNPLGVALLIYLAPDPLRIIIACITLAASIVLLTGWTLSRSGGTAGDGAVGMVSGVANGATALGGLPVALFLVSSGQTHASVRANLIAYFFFSDFYAGCLFASQGVLNWGTLHAAVWSLPVLVAGLLLGTRQYSLATPEAFRRFVLCLLVALSVMVLAKAAGVV